MISDTPHKILIDTDIGEDIDDILSLAFALISPEFQVLGVTTTDGDTHARARIARRLAAVCGRPDLPVAAGFMRNMPQPNPDTIGRGSVTQWDLAPDEEGLPPASPASAVDLIADAAEAHPGQVSLLTIGSMTNVGQTFVRRPDSVAHLKQVVTNGGVFGGGAKQTIGWNLRYDPVAASIVARGPVPWVLLPENATAASAFRQEDESCLRESSGLLCQLLASAVDLWRQNKKDTGGRPPHLSDMNVFAYLMGILPATRADVAITVTRRGKMPGLSVTPVDDGIHLAGAPLPKRAAQTLREQLLQRLTSWNG